MQKRTGWLAGSRVNEVVMETGNGTADVPPKRMKKSSDPEPKNALQQLNEMVPGLKYECTQTGQHHEPTFTVHVTVNDQVCAAQPLRDV